MLGFIVFCLLHRVEGDHSQGVRDDPVQVWLAILRFLVQDADQLWEVSDQGFFKNLRRFPVDFDVLLFLLWLHVAVLFG